MKYASTLADLKCDVCKQLPWSTWAHKTKKLRCLCNGANIDLACGSNKNKGYVGVDQRDLAGVDLVWDLEALPWPLPSSCADLVTVSHYFEHVKPWLTVQWMNELWRIMDPDGRVMIVVPYGTSYGYYQDPTHCNPCVEATWGYFDPGAESELWLVYQPKPWQVVHMSVHPYANMEVVLLPRKLPNGDPVLVTQQNGKILLGDPKQYNLEAKRGRVIKKQ